MAFEKIDLYGGAITVDLPTAFGDVRFVYPCPPIPSLSQPY
jgi:hypothetical protein